MQANKELYSTRTFVSDLDGFLDLLCAAAAAVGERYFQLPVAGAEDTQYRERVYSYELYHQLRSRWPQALHRYDLGGEVDKGGHRLVRGNGLDRAKPDLIVHVPGSMESNLAVVEIKAWLPDQNEVAVDLKKLSAFVEHAGYAGGVYLVYGSRGADPDALLDRCRAACENATIPMPDSVRLLLHSSAGTVPVSHSW